MQQGLQIEPGQPGGGITAMQTQADRYNEVDISHAKALPDALSYMDTSLRTGILHRPNGLFPPEDEVLRVLQQKGYKPFEKHLLDVQSNALVPSFHSWAAGNDAANHGLDLRCFLDIDTVEEMVGAKLFAAVRFGDLASIGNGMSAHGGAIETALDEATAELAKITNGVACVTSSIEYKLKKKVRLHRTYKIDAEIVKVGPGGLRIYIDAFLKDLDGSVLVACAAQMANIAKLKSARRA